MARVFDLRKFTSSRARGLPDLEPPKERQTRRKRSNPFVMVDLATEAAAAHAMGTQKHFVWLLVQYLAWKEKVQTVPLSNLALAKYGIDRRSKKRALAGLERAGLVRVIRHGSQSVRVVVL
jgi:hypothetical protein